MLVSLFLNVILLLLLLLLNGHCLHLLQVISQMLLLLLLLPMLQATKLLLLVCLDPTVYSSAIACGVIGYTVYELLCGRQLLATCGLS
jgi:hypothetical protein